MKTGSLLITINVKISNKIVLRNEALKPFFVICYGLSFIQVEKGPEAAGVAQAETVKRFGGKAL